MMVKNTIKQLIDLNNILIPFIEGLANKAEIESTYVKKSELQEKLENKANADQIPDVSLLVEKQK